MIPYDQDPTPAPHKFRIYSDDSAQTWAVVDEVDYHWLIQWRWHINEPHHTRKGTKRYFRTHAGWRTMGSRYLHVEVMKRTGIIPPSELHTLVNHIDGNEWNCLRINLEWATPSMNNKNVKKGRCALVF